MSDQDHGAGSQQVQATIAGVEQADAEQRAQGEAQKRERLQQGPARLLHAQREQVELLAVDLDSVLPADHQARLVWGYVQRQDWSKIESRIKARGSAPGRRAIDPRILYALWLYATLQGVGSGREIARLSCVHDAYRWICGGVGVNYHALNDFRAENERWFDELLSDNVAALAVTGVIKLERVAHDGVRVRANAGAASFRRREKLTKQLGMARELVRTLKEQARTDPGAANRRAQAARERAAIQREQRIEAALARLPEIEETKRRNGGKAENARASTTDAQATVMKMADGGFRPAYNVQYASDCASQMVVGVEVTTSGSDMAQLAPMVEQVEQRAGRAPEQWLVDGGFPAHEQLDAVAHKTEVYAPVPKPRPASDKRDKDGAGNGGQDTNVSDGQDAAKATEPPRGRKRVPAQTWRQCGGSQVARAHGQRPSARDLQGSCGHGRVRQCPDAQPRLAAHAHAWAAAGARYRVAARYCTQPQTHDGTCSADAASASIPTVPEWVRSVETEKLPQKRTRRPVASPSAPPPTGASTPPQSAPPSRTEWRIK